jgi:2-phosphosulfolactate phosphatase
MPGVQVCYTPLQYPLFRNDDDIVVVIDVLRATSAMVTAIAHGAAGVIPVAKVEDARAFSDKGYILAAERDGRIVEGFDYGNSPFSFMGEAVQDKTIVLSTTNGTQAIEAARQAYALIAGAFINLDAVCDYLKQEGRGVLLLCAGWKNKFNLEDSIFAGAVVQHLLAAGFSTDCDSARASAHLWNLSKNNLNAFLEDSSHRNRLGRLELKKDIEYCLQTGITDAIPVLKNDVLVKLK